MEIHIPTSLANVLIAFGISILMSVVSFVLINLLKPFFDRTNGNDAGSIALIFFGIIMVVASLVAVVGSLIFGLTFTLFIVVGIIFLVGVVVYLSMLT